MALSGRNQVPDQSAQCAAKTFATSGSGASGALRTFLETTLETNALKRV
jgi:hypothetical protein